jgi:SPX domain protein involved in polyphosphate accumulation
MKNRVEYKYLVPLDCIDELRNDLLRYLDYDNYATRRPNKEYTVHSVYLDSYDYKCYYEKLDGIHTRKKFRIRGYNRNEDGSKVFLEIKRKSDNFISKDRAGAAFQEIQKSLDNSHSESYFSIDQQSHYNNFYYYYHLRRLEPKVLIVYEREPFECKFGSQLRITFDKNLRSKIVSDYQELFNEDILVERFRKEFIFEIKFFQVLPQWISRVLIKYDLTRIAVSKYTSSIDTHNRSSVSMNKLTRNDFF